MANRTANYGATAGRGQDANFDDGRVSSDRPLNSGGPGRYRRETTRTVLKPNVTLDYSSKEDSMSVAIFDGRTPRAPVFRLFQVRARRESDDSTWVVPLAWPLLWPDSIITPQTMSSARSRLRASTISSSAGIESLQISYIQRCCIGFNSRTILFGMAKTVQ